MRVDAINSFRRTNIQKNRSKLSYCQITQDNMVLFGKTDNKYANTVLKLIKNYAKVSPKELSELSPIELFKLFNIEATEDEQGMLTISDYRQPDEHFTFDDLGIDENELFKRNRSKPSVQQLRVTSCEKRKSLINSSRNKSNCCCCQNDSF